MKNIKKYCFLINFVFLINSNLLYAQENAVWKKPVSEYKIKTGRIGGELIRSITSDPRSFNPIIAKETSTTIITSLIFEGLTKTNPATLEVEPNLAKDWEVDDNGKRWVFNLRKDVFWSDGNRFTADDVVFTFNDLIYNPDIPNSSKDILTIEGKQIKVNKIDDFTVEFLLPVVFAPFLRAMSQDILPKHRLKETVKNKTFSFTWGINVKEEEVIGTGPFILKKYSPGERVILERNVYYRKKDENSVRLPYLDKMIFIILQSQDTAILKFMDGELDFYSLRGEDLPILGPIQYEKDFTIYNAGPSFGSNFITFNQNPGVNPFTNELFIPQYKLNWFRNINFRRAVSYAIDRDKIVDIVYNGLGYRQYSPMSPTSGYFYNPDVKRYELDLEKAKAILESEGFKDRNNDGILQDKKGNPVEFTLITNSGNTERMKIASMIRKDLSNLGMRVNFLALEFNNLVSKLTSTFDWEATLIGFTGGIEPHFGNNVWHSSGHLHVWHPLQDEPNTDWEKEIDKIFTKGVQVLDREKRKELYDRWQVLVSEKLPVIYTAIPASLYAVRNKFGNLYPTVYGGPFGEIEYVYVIETKK